MACLDTNVIVDLLRPRSVAHRRARTKLAELSGRDEEIVTTRFNLAELYVGIERSDDPGEEERAVRAVLRGYEVLGFSDRAARWFGSITAHLQGIGRPAGDIDILIAATCMAEGHLLVTRNPVHFTDIPHLVVESY